MLAQNLYVQISELEKNLLNHIPSQTCENRRVPINRFSERAQTLLHRWNRHLEEFRNQTISSTVCCGMSRQRRQTPPHIEPQRRRLKPRIQQVLRQRMLRNRNAIHRSNQQPAATTLTTISLQLLHLGDEKLRQRTSSARPPRLFLRQHHLHIRIPAPQIGRQRTIDQHHPRPHTPRQRRTLPREPPASASALHKDSPGPSPPASRPHSNPHSPRPAATAINPPQQAWQTASRLRSAAKYPRRTRPLSSSAFSTSYTAENPPGRFSAWAVSRNTTP